MKRYFTLEYWEDDGWYVGRLPEVPGVFSQGETVEDLTDNIIDAFREMREAEVPSSAEVHTVEIGVDL